MHPSQRGMTPPCPSPAGWLVAGARAQGVCHLPRRAAARLPWLCSFLGETRVDGTWWVVSAEASFCNSPLIEDAVAVFLRWFGADREGTWRAAGLQQCCPRGSLLHLSVPSVFGANPSIWEGTVRFTASSLLCALPASRM